MMSLQNLIPLLTTTRRQSESLDLLVAAIASADVWPEIRHEDQAGKDTAGIVHIAIKASKSSRPSAQAIFTGNNIPAIQECAWPSFFPRHDLKFGKPFF
ncbi:hypothetical protein [Oceanisphaera psychrotolerans]|uniref:Uncharacterized protein n=1 Tax=Oceanisphaera psychrotolerans TaxID=1414654 RepID=A0A1J4QFE6_9GAMM|nr:hypothetical protein [Oceanisphaera psychrotolerans]OIN12216.1 hypothetical protein BFR47_00490 [Oceanisphaera psychrotolerans]